MLLKEKIINHLDENCNLISIEFRTSFLGIVIKRFFINAL